MRAYFPEFGLEAEEQDGTITYLKFSKAGEQTALSPLLKLLHEELSLYFDGKLYSFSVPYRLSGTSFQNKVWTECAKIPYGETATYKALAERAGYKGATRAVGTAMRDNKIVIIIPCHRVIRCDGGMGGYAGGLEMKLNLLKLEKESRGF